MASDHETPRPVRVRPEDIRRGWFVALAIVLTAMSWLVALSLLRNGTAHHWHVAYHNPHHIRAHCPA
jgi:hypothetical protein